MTIKEIIINQKKVICDYKINSLCNLQSFLENYKINSDFSNQTMKYLSIKKIKELQINSNILYIDVDIDLYDNETIFINKESRLVSILIDDNTYLSIIM